MLTRYYSTVKFDSVEIIDEALVDEPPELEWLNQALDGRRRAVIWSSPPGLVAPRSYRKYERLDTACQEFAQHGTPVRLRRSGGGVVPQGPGILNLTLTYPADGPHSGGAENAYHHLCGTIARALVKFGISSQTLPVEGAFCDGRFNLSVPCATGPRKLAGTAQYWRRHKGRSAVLAHALILVDTDIHAITELATEFEAALCSGRAYCPDAVTDVATEWQCSKSGTVPENLYLLLAKSLQDILNSSPSEGDFYGPA